MEEAMRTYPRSSSAVLAACGLALLLTACSDDTAPVRQDTRAPVADQYPYNLEAGAMPDGKTAADTGAKGDTGVKPDTVPPVCPGQGTTACTEGGQQGKCWAGSCCTGCYEGFSKKCYGASSTVAICGNNGNACQTCAGNEKCVNYVCQ